MFAFSHPSHPLAGDTHELTFRARLKLLEITAALRPSSSITLELEELATKAEGVFGRSHRVMAHCSMQLARAELSALSKAETGDKLLGRSLAWLTQVHVSYLDSQEKERRAIRALDLHSLAAATCVSGLNSWKHYAKKENWQGMLHLVWNEIEGFFNKFKPDPNREIEQFSLGLAVSGSLQNMRLLVDIRTRRGEHAEAARLLSDIIDVQENSKELPLFRLADSLVRLATLHETLQSHAKALEFLERAMHIQADFYGPDSTIVSDTMAATRRLKTAMAKTRKATRARKASTGWASSTGGVGTGWSSGADALESAMQSNKAKAPQNRMISTHQVGAHTPAAPKRRTPRNATGSSTGAIAAARGHMRFERDFSKPSHEADPVSKRSFAERHLDEIFAEDLRRAERSGKRKQRQSESRKKTAAQDTSAIDAELQSLFEECLGADAL